VLDGRRHGGQRARGHRGRATYGPDSFGSLDACTFLDVPEVESVVGAGRPLTRQKHGHTCLHGYVGLAFSVGVPNTGTPETIAGRAAVVETAGVFCVISFDRPMPDRPGLVERAELTGVAIDENRQGNGAGVCPDTGAVADVVVPKLPQ
jgi:hypothetical protein